MYGPSPGAYARIAVIIAISGAIVGGVAAIALYQGIAWLWGHLTVGWK